MYSLIIVFNCCYTYLLSVAIVVPITVSSDPTQLSNLHNNDDVFDIQPDQTVSRALAEHVAMMQLKIVSHFLFIL